MLRDHFSTLTCALALFALSVFSPVWAQGGGALPPQYCATVELATPGVEYIFDLAVDGQEAGFVSLTGDMDHPTQSFDYEVLGAFKLSTGEIALTAVNPRPSFCDGFSDSITLTGTVTFGGGNLNLSGTYRGNCQNTLSAWSGTATEGACSQAAAAPVQATVAAPSGSYPNPFASATTITYDLPEQAHVTVTVYDALGRQVVTLVNEVQEGGAHSVQWDGRGSAGASLASGSYTYRIEAGAYRETRQVTLVK